MKYFTHEINSRTDDRVFELIDTHGLAGYGFFWVILEELYGSEETGFQIEATNIWMKRLARSVNLTDDRTIIRYFDTFADLGLIDKQMWHERIIYSQGVMQRADSYMEKKAKEAEKKRSQRAQAKPSIDCPESVISDSLGTLALSLGTKPMSLNVPLSYADPYADPNSNSQTDPNTEKENTREENIYTPPVKKSQTEDLPCKQNSIVGMAKEKETPPPTPAPLPPENVGLAIAGLKTRKPRKAKDTDMESLRSCYQAFLEVFNQDAPDKWKRYTKLTAKQVEDVDRFAKKFGDRAIEIFQKGLMFAKTSKFHTVTVDWDIAQYLTNNKPLDFAEKYEASLSQQYSVDRSMTPNRQKIASDYTTILEAIYVRP